MKKKVLFIQGVLDTGGVSKSLLNLLSVFDKNQYDVTLLLMNPHNSNLKKLPNDINLLTDSIIENLLRGTYGLLGLLKGGHLLMFLGSLVRLCLSVLDKGRAGLWLSKLFPTITDVEYDLIVDYGGQQQLYYMVDKLLGKVKVSFFHSDYHKWNYYYNIDKIYYPKIDKIFTISEKCVKSLKDYFPKESDKIELMENISSVSIIEELSSSLVSDFLGDVKFLTIGHISKNKGTDIAIKAASILKKRGLIFKWYFIGSILEDFSSLIEEYGLEDEICMLGTRDNPYPYLLQATMYIHPSLFEGKSLALDEAKILCKPIVVTNFSTVTDQFENRVNASICEINPTSLANAIWNLYNDNDLSNSYVDYLKRHRTDNTQEIEKLYSLLD